MKTFVIYLLHGVPQVGEVVGETKTKLRVKGSSGKEMLLPKGRVIVSKSEASSLKEIEEASSAEEKSIDLELLHEASLAEGKERLSVEELSSLYFGPDPSMSKVFAMFKAVYSDKFYFKRWKDFTFSPRTHSELEFVKEEERRREFEEKRLREAVMALRGLSERDGMLLDMVKLFLEDPDSMPSKDRSFIEKALKEVNKDPRKAAVDVLKRKGMLEGPFKEVLYLGGIRVRFPREVEVFSRKVADSFCVDLSFREDLRDLFVFTIDDEDTKEVDDGLSYERVGDTDVVYVHISDLTPMVRMDDPVDREAFKRGSSIYAPDSVYPMIPTPISFDVGSLVEGKERYALSFRFYIKDGVVIDSDLIPSVVVVGRRLSYEEADRLIREGSGGISDVLRRMLDIARSLKRKREKKGGFLLPRRDLKITVVDGDRFSLKVIDPLSPSRFMVSEFMILYNHMASRFSLENSIPVIYRSQPPPDEGFSLSLNGLTYQDELPLDVLREVFSRIKPSKLSLYPSPHWGLGLDSYIQVTSPIRRYSDLALQRQLVSFIINGKPAYSEMDLMKVVALSEDSAKEVKTLERDLQSRALAWFFGRLDETIEGIVRDRTSRGYLVSPMGLPVRLPLVSDRVLEFGSRIKIRPRLSGDYSVIFEDVGDANG